MIYKYRIKKNLLEPDLNFFCTHGQVNIRKIESGVMDTKGWQPLCFKNRGFFIAKKREKENDGDCKFT